MARPPKYDWKSIESDFKAGLNKERICLKYGMEEKTLNNKIYEKKWLVSSTAKSVMSGLSEVSGGLGQIEVEEPEILESVYNRIRTESEFDLVSGRLVIKTMKKLEKIVDTGIKSEKINVGMGVQNFENVEMTGGDYLDVMNAAYRAKELIKGKDTTASQNINVQTNVGIQTITEDLRQKANRLGIVIK